MLRGHWTQSSHLQLRGEPGTRPYEGMAKVWPVGPSLSFFKPVADIANQSLHSLTLSQREVPATGPGLSGGYNLAELQET